MMKRIILLALVIVLLLSSVACQNTLIPPATELIPFAPPERTEVAGSFSAKLFYILKNTGALSYEVHDIEVYNDKPTLEILVNKLLEEPKYDYHRNPINKSYTLTDIEVSEGVANIFFNGDEFNSNSATAIKQYLETQAVILASLEMFGVNAVNVYVNGVAPSYKSCPVGYATKPNGELFEHISETIRDYTAYKELSYDSPYTSNCIFYVNDKSGYFLANKQRLVIKNEASNKELVNVVLERFITLYDDYLPPDIEFLEIDINEYSGKQNVSITVDGNLNDETIEMLRAGITLTLTGYVPDLHYVTIIFDGISATIQRKDYAYTLGNTAKAYYPYLINDVLSIRYITINKGLACCYLKDYLIKYFASSVENGSIFRGMKEEYIIDVYANNGIAVLNLSQEFYDFFDNYINNEHAIVDGDVSERLIIYGIVNSLTEIHYIDSVLFLCEGKNLGVIKNLYLGAPLYKNIGLVYGA